MTSTDCAERKRATEAQYRIERMREGVAQAEVKVVARRAALDAAMRDLDTAKSDLDDALKRAEGLVGERRPTDMSRMNRVVAYNMAWWRKHRGLTQEQLGARLGQVTGRPWSKAVVSAAERSWESTRTRQFDADEIAALSQCLDAPVAAFFAEPYEEAQ